MRFREFATILTLFLFIIITLAGCREMDRFYGYMQYAGPKVAPGKMTMTIGDGKYDIRKAMTKQAYEGEVKSGRVTALYIKGSEKQAKEAADAFDRMYDVVQKRLGIPWAFDITLMMVDASEVPGGWSYSDKIRSNRRLTFPLPVDANGSFDTVAASVIAHEITEASMFYPVNRRLMLLGDAWVGKASISYHTRWFRDGLSDYAANVFAEDVLGVQPIMTPDYMKLVQIKEAILKWKNPKHEEYYGAALALIYEIVNRYGEESIPKIVDEISKDKATGGSELRSAVKRATGLDLREFLLHYQVPKGTEKPKSYKPASSPDALNTTSQQESPSQIRSSKQ